MPMTDDGTKVKPLRALGDEDAQTLVRYFKLFADETRVRILHYLAQRRELNVQSLCELLDQTQPAVSHHLAILRAHALIEMRRQGKHNYYHVRAERFDDIRDLLSLIEPPIN